MEEFDCRGNVSSMTLESVRPHPEPAEQHEEQRLFVAKLFYNHTGLLIQKQEPRKTTYYHYGEERLLEREVEVRTAENISRERSYEYSAGRILSETCGSEKITYHYNSRDVLNYTTTWSAGEQESVCSFGYDQNGRIILKEIRDAEGVLLRSLSLERDPRGLITSELLVNQDNMVLEQITYRYPVFHSENWLKRESWSIKEGKDPLLTEILYRNITMSAAGKPPETPAPRTDEDDIASGLPEDTSIALPGGRYRAKSKDEALSEGPSTQETPVTRGPEDSEDSGETVEKRYRNGRFRGSVDNKGLPHGEGEFWGRDGSRYSGSFVNGHMEGQGILLHKNGSSYTGEFKEGFPHGRGECVWPDGSRYKGQFVRGEMHGIGAFTWSDGSRFTGLFQHNSSTDQGLLENAESSAGSSADPVEPPAEESTL